MAFIRISLFTLVLSGCSTVTASGQSVLKKNDESGPFNDVFETLVNETLELWHVPALSIAVVDGDDTWARVCLHFNLRPVLYDEMPPRFPAYFILFKEMLGFVGYAAQQ